MVISQAGDGLAVVFFVGFPAITLAVAIALSVYGVSRLGEYGLLVVIATLGLMLQQQVLEAYVYWQTGEVIAGGLGEVFETSATLVAAGSVSYVSRFAGGERRRVDELRRDEREYRRLIETSPVPMLVHDSDGIRYANLEAIDVLGAEDEQKLVRMDLAEFLPTTEPQQLRNELLTDGGREELESRLRTLEDRTRRVVVTGTPVAFEGSQKTLLVIRDATEQKRGEREFQQIFNGVHDAISINDPETGEILQVNDSLCELVGYDRERILELGVDSISANEEGFTRQRAKEFFQAVADGGEPRTTQWAVETSEGETRWLEVNGTTADIGGERRVITANRDVTERRNREREYEQIFNNVNDAISVFDPETAEILDVNDTYRAMFGYDDLETIRRLGIDGLTVTEEGYEPERGRELIRDVAATGEPRTVEWLGQHRNGERVWTEATLTLAEVGGEERVLSIQRDVTERKRRQREYQQIFDSVNDGIVVFDPDTLDILDANQAYLDIIGYDLDEMQERGVAGLSVTEEGYTPERGMAVHQRVVETGDPELVEWQGETKDGNRVWLEVKVARAVLNGEERTISIHRDITNRKRREEAIRALQEATERMQTAETPEEVAEMAVETASEVLDLPRAVCWFHDAEDRQLEPVATTAAVAEAETSALAPGDEEYGVFLSGEVSSYARGEVADERPFESGVLLPLGDHGLVAAGRKEALPADDVVLEVATALAEHTTTALARVERAQAVRESEQRLRLIAEHIDEVIFLARGDLSETLYVNPAYEDVWGRPVEELYDDPRAFVESVDPRDRDRVDRDLDAIADATDRGEMPDSYDFEYRIRRPDGEIRWLRGSGYPVALDDGSHRFIGVTEDITERKRHEQRLEVFNRILRHNLRNRIDVIKGHAERLLQTTDSDHVSRIIGSADRLDAIAGEARRIDRIMSRQRKETVVDLSTFVATTLDSVGGPDRNVELHLDVPEEAVLRTDREAIEAVLASALENAVSHAETAVRVAVEGSATGYVVSIADDGPGIPDEELAPLNAGTETDLQHGRGLGLWQVKWGVEKLGGTIEFDTTDGTTIRLTVPDLARNGS